jgi:superfamily II DNA or RNA helicase
VIRILEEASVKIRERKYQSRGIDWCWKKALKGIRGALVSPAGSGKSVMIARLTARAVKKQWRVLILAHRKEIINQLESHLKSVGLQNPSVLLRPYERYRESAQVQVSSVQALSRRRLKGKFDLIITDECHHAPARSYQNIYKRHKAAAHVGFTATPVRLDNKGLGGTYDELLNLVYPSMLIKNHQLARPHMYSAKSALLPDLEGVPVIGPDYKPSALEKKVTTQPVIGGIVDNWMRLAKGKKTLAFAVSIKHSLSIKERFAKQGIRTAHLDGYTKDAEREEVLKGFRDGDITILCNCELFVEGFDLPEIECVILARPTMSFAKAYQSANRGLRYNKGSRPIILDHALHSQKFGFPHADWNYTLSLGEGLQHPPIRICGECDAVMPAHYKACEECGHEFDMKERVTIPQEITGNLDHIDDSVLKGIRERAMNVAKRKGMTRVEARAWVREIMKPFAA